MRTDGKSHFGLKNFQAGSNWGRFSWERQSPDWRFLTVKTTTNREIGVPRGSQKPPPPPPPKPPPDDPPPPNPDPPLLLGAEAITEPARAVMLSRLSRNIIGRYSVP